MAAATKPTEKPPAKARPTRRWPLVLVLAAGLAGAGYGVWRMAEPLVTGTRHYGLQVERIQITEVPAWIRADVRGEVLRDAGLDDTHSVLDTQLAQRLAATFKLHPWVARVSRVALGADGGAQVELVYRRPVCMVEVPGGLYPIDQEAVLLPTADFTADDARQYPRLAGIEASTEGPVGTPWQDMRVTRAAELAARLAEDWQPLGFERIVALGGPETAEPEFELRTSGGTRVLWGHARKDASAGQPTAEEKLARLKQYAAAHGGLDWPAPQDIDVRGDALRTAPRSAAAPDARPEGSRPTSLR